VVADEPVAPLTPLEHAHAVVAAGRDDAVAGERAGRGEAAVLESLGKLEPHDPVGEVRDGADRPVAAVVRRHAGRADGERAAREDRLERAAERRQPGSGQPRPLKEGAPIEHRHQFLLEPRRRPGEHIDPGRASGMIAR